MSTRKGIRSAKGTGKSAVVSPVKGGWVKRETGSGHFMEVQSESGTYRSSRTSEAVVDEASKKRHEALKRLADR